jgi:hypothetical protein
MLHCGMKFVGALRRSVPQRQVPCSAGPRVCFAASDARLSSDPENCYRYPYFESHLEIHTQSSVLGSVGTCGVEAALKSAA